MGCDIHPAIEANLFGERWSLCAMPDGLPRDRDYFSFSVMANVRNNYSYVVPISEPRGLPPDLSPELTLLIKDNEFILGEHSYSWLTLEECEAVDWKTRLPGDVFWVVEEMDPLFAQLTADMQRIYELHKSWLERSGGKKNIRIVFGFDS